jgi:SAM-dependent methyltransferase
MDHSYDSKFMAYTDQSSRHSAQRIAGIVREVLSIDSVLDVGCARGTWLATWKALGTGEIFGVDGDYVSTTDLLIPAERFLAADLSHSFDLKRVFDLVQSLEVAEHVSADSADVFVDNLVKHSKGIILFSAAPPGQGGEFHINEQPYDYWRKKFALRGYKPYDFIRPIIAADSAVSFWYRFNTLLYVHENTATKLPSAICSTLVPEEHAIADVSPPAFRARKFLIRLLPYVIQHNLARLKARTANIGKN